MNPPHHLCLFFSFFFLFVALILSSPLAISLPLPPTTPPNNLTLPQPPLRATNNCIPKRSLFTPCPAYFDCVQAILQLPNLQGQGSFHNGAPDDVFRLPVEKTHESCRVRVELRHQGSSRQSSSWHVVVARAVRLAEV